MVEQFIDHLIDKRVDENTLGILFIDKLLDGEKNITDFAGVLLFIVDRNQQSSVEHYDLNNRAVHLQFIQKDEINRILINGSNRSIIDWLLNGNVLYESKEYITWLRNKIVEFPSNERKYKMTVEFSKLIRRYIDGKKFFQTGHLLDAFNSILHSLHHLARLSVIEHGYYPEVTVWKQVKQIEPEIFKLYEEMVIGEDNLEKRLELVLLANNFALTSKTKNGAGHLLEILKIAEEPISIAQLINHAEVKEYAVDLNVLIDYLVQKGLVDILKVQTKDERVAQRLYYVK